MSRPNEEVDPEGLAAAFAKQTFTPEQLSDVKKTRRRAPRLGDAKAEVYSFRAPPTYKDRVRQRAKTERKTESQVIREALDAYLG